MSTIRFIHTDYLRLAASLQGIAAAPGWLQEALTDATRRATRQTIETAITEQADFLLIAGGVTDNQEDLEIACAWLNEQFAVARRAGIQIVAVSDHETQAVALRQVCDMVVDRQQTLVASPMPTGQTRLTASVASSIHRNDLVISFDGVNANHTDAACHYHAFSRTAVDVHPEHRSRNHYESTAGAIQSVGPVEQWNGHCVVVSTDLDSQTIQTTPVDVSSIRYATERLSIDGRTSPGRLVEEIAMASRNLRRHSTETVLVDWVITTALECRGSHDARSLEESELLAALRTDLHSGHQGVWPRSVRFSEQSSIDIVNQASPSVSLLEGIAKDVQYNHGQFQTVTPALLCSLAALQEAA